MLKSYLSKLLTAVFMMASLALIAQSDATVTVGSGSAAGDYAARQAVFGPGITADITAPLSFPTDTSGATTVCNLIDMDLAGTIALVDRGGCAFVAKVTNAEAAGAMAVIVCNSVTAVPTQAFAMGGDDMGVLTIPSVMLSFGQCEAIRAGDPAAMVTLAANTDPAGPAETCSTAEVVTPGTYTIADITTGFGGVFASTGHAKWYSYTPAANTLATVTNCGVGVDSRVNIISGTNCDLSDAVVVAGNDNCDYDNGVFSSETSWAAEAGVNYWIVWDDRWSNAGFDWTLSEGDLPMVNVTVTVDMQDETVAPEGVFLAGSHNGWPDPGDPMTDNGDGTWTGTFMATTLETVEYKFQNGPGGWENITGDCTFGDFGNRFVTVGGTDDIVVSAVCFNSCEICPPDVSCPNWIQDDFEGYTLGGVSDQSPHLTQWTPGSAGEDSNVTDVFANSGSQSMEVSAADPDDMLLLLGNRTEGNFILKWKMYVPAGSGGYWNIQKIEETPGGEFGTEVVLNPDGTGSYIVAGGEQAFAYPHDTWFDVYNSIDIDNDRVNVWVNGAFAASHALSDNTSGPGGMLQLGAIDLFGLGSSSTLYYVDDILFKEVDPCPAGSIICDGLDGYDMGDVGPQSPHWLPWSLSDGAGDDAVVTNAEFFSCEAALEISEAGGDDLLLLLGDRTEGRYSVSWKMLVPEGSSAYYNFQKVEQSPGAEFGMQIVFNADGTASLDAEVAGVATPTYTQGAWIDVEHEVDLDNDVMSLWLEGAMVHSWAASSTTFGTGGMLQLGGVDFFGNTGNLYYIDDVRLVQLPSLPGNVCAGAQDLSGIFGGGLNNVVTSDIYDNTGYSTTGADPADGWECFGEPDGGGAAPSLENTIWFSFVGDGETYFIETGDCDGTTDYIDDGDTQIAVYTGDCGALTPVACNEDGPNAVVGNYIAAVELPTEAGVTYYMLIDGFNFNGAISDGQFCINATQLTEPVPVNMTVTVDMNLEEVSAEGVFISGSFNGWPNPGDPLTDNGDGTWSGTVAVPANTVVEYKFQNGTDGWENINVSLGGDGCLLGEFGNRMVSTADMDVTVDVVCFNSCVSCDLVEDVFDPAFAGSFEVFPNPATGITNIQYSLDKTVDLTIQITNALGQEVRTELISNAIEGTHTIDVSELAAGVYMIRMTDGERTASQSLVVE